MKYFQDTFEYYIRNMDGNEQNKFSGEIPNEYEKKELRIIKQAIAKSFISSGKIELTLTKEIEEQMESWIRWVYRSEEKDWKIIKEKERPF